MKLFAACDQLLYVCMYVYMYVCMYVCMVSFEVSFVYCGLIYIQYSACCYIRFKGK